MLKKKNLLKLSVALLIFNVLIGSLSLFNDWKAKEEISKARTELSKESQVLGVNSNIPTFDKNFVISNDTFSSTRVFPTEASVQRYLEQVNSPLKNYVADAKPASYWIFGAARGSTSSKYGVVPNLNPAVILTFLEKEQSLLSLKNYDVYRDPEKRIRYAMGYGCPDTSVCDAKYNGFVNQVNWAAYQLQFNYNNSVSGSYVLPFKVQNTITTLDEYNVFLTNEATAAIYRYTPHVYWGAYNTWKIVVANGWGQNSSTFDMSILDQSNLGNKDVTVDLPQNGTIDPASISGILKSGCSLGQTSDNIKTIQKFLRQQGYFMNREITGVCGTITKRALEVYFGRGGEILDQPAVISDKIVYATSNGVNASGLNSRSNPCGPLADPTPISWGQKGSVLAGPSTKACLGGNWNWYQIKWEDESLGWSVSSYLSDKPSTTNNPAPSTSTPDPVTNPSTQKVVTKSQGVKATGLNLRSAPCGTKIAVIPWSTQGTITEAAVTKSCLGGNIQWVKVKFSNGKSGWVASQYLG